jgi:predicted RNA-binding Zn-ribbon protein involved in translation (DUF1610 family)
MKDENKVPDTEVSENAQEVATTITTELICPHCGNKIVIERPAPQRRGQLAGLEIDVMTDEQLKRERINSSSVLYKAQKRGASADTIAKNQARVDAVKAEIAKREAVKAPAPTVAVEADAPAEQSM